MAETEQQRHADVTKETRLSPRGDINSKAMKVDVSLQRRMSSSSESGFESEFQPDDLSSSQPSSADSIVTSARLSAWSDESERISKLEKIDSIKTVIHQLAYEVVSHMTGVHLDHAATPYSATLLRVVADISSRHEIVFESIVRRLGLGGSPNYSACQQTIVGVGNELFADGQYNWGRTVTMFAFTGWLACSCCRNSGNKCSSSNDCLARATVIADVAGEYMADKLSQWIYSQGGWDAMERFFAQPEPLESKLWRCMMFSFVGLGVLAAIAAVR